MNGIHGALTGTDLTERGSACRTSWFRTPDRTLEGKDIYLYWSRADARARASACHREPVSSAPALIRQGNVGSAASEFHDAQRS